MGFPGFQVICRDSELRHHHQPASRRPPSDNTLSSSTTYHPSPSALSLSLPPRHRPSPPHRHPPARPLPTCTPQHRTRQLRRPPEAHGTRRCLWPSPARPTTLPQSFDPDVLLYHPSPCIHLDPALLTASTALYPHPPSSRLPLSPIPPATRPRNQTRSNHAPPPRRDPPAHIRVSP